LLEAHELPLKNEIACENEKTAARPESIRSGPRSDGAKHGGMKTFRVAGFQPSLLVVNDLSGRRVQKQRALMLFRFFTAPLAVFVFVAEVKHVV